MEEGVCYAVLCYAMLCCAMLCVLDATFSGLNVTFKPKMLHLNPLRNTFLSVYQQVLHLELQRTLRFAHRPAGGSGGGLVRHAEGVEEKLPAAASAEADVFLNDWFHVFRVVKI